MDPAQRIRMSFSKQGLMSTLGATLGTISPGAVEIVLHPSPAISQQHGSGGLAAATAAL
jgi:acyl-coenzyme A thioesterase PaaI-like protein